jgi:hypothetical protein
MASRTHQGPGLPALLAISVASAGCSPEFFFRQARQEVRAQLRADSPARNQLESTSNPRGPGAVVFTRSPGSCEPDGWWLVSNKGQAFAFDARSQALTPAVPLLIDHTPYDHNDGPRDRASFDEAIRRQICDRAPAGVAPRR